MDVWANINIFKKHLHFALASIRTSCVDNLNTRSIYDQIYLFQTTNGIAFYLIRMVYTTGVINLCSIKLVMLHQILPVQTILKQPLALTFQ